MTIKQYRPDNVKPVAHIDLTGVVVATYVHVGATPAHGTRTHDATDEHGTRTHEDARAHEDAHEDARAHEDMPL